MFQAKMFNVLKIYIKMFHFLVLVAKIPHSNSSCNYFMCALFHFLFWRRTIPLKKRLWKWLIVGFIHSEQRKKSKSTWESFIPTAIEFVMGKKSKPKQLTWKVKAFKWKGFISLDCVHGNIYSFRCVQRSWSLNLFVCSTLRSLLFSLPLPLPLHNALNIHYPKRKTKCITLRLVMLNSLCSNSIFSCQSHQPFISLFFIHLSPLQSFMVCVYACSVTCPHSAARFAATEAAIQIMPLQFHQSWKTFQQPLHFAAHISNIETICRIKNVHCCWNMPAPSQQHTLCVYWLLFFSHSHHYPFSLCVCLCLSSTLVNLLAYHLDMHNTHT